MKILQINGTTNTTYKANRSIQYIVIHYTAGTNSKQGMARNIANMFKNGTVGGSADFIVDDVEFVQYNKDIKNRYCWAVGGSKYKTLSTTLGANLYNKCTNTNSISIEVCSSKTNKKSLNINDTDWYFTDSVLNNAVELTKYLMKTYNIPINNVIMHHQVTGKLCLPTDITEVLTANGWKLLKDTQVGEKIVCYSSNTNFLQFSPILDKVIPYVATTLKNRGLEATADHNMYIRNNYTDSKFKTQQWEEILNVKSSKIILTNGIFENYKGLDLTDDELRFLVWVQGDGSYMKRQTGSYRGLDFHFSKMRKVEALCSLLDNLGFLYKYTKQINGSIRIKVNDNNLVNWCEQYLHNKQFTYEFINMTMEQYKIFINELVIVDGNITCNSYCSAIENNLDVVQAIHATHNTRSNKCQTGTSRNVITTTANYTVGINSKYTNKEDWIITRETEVSCVTVDTGLILIRQGGKTFIVGNCPQPWVLNQSRLQGWYAFLDRLANKSQPVQPKKVYMNTKISINGKMQEYDSINIDGYTYVEARKFLETLGYNVSWDNNKKRATVDNSLTLDIATLLENNKSYIQVRETIDFLNKYDTWKFTQDKTVTWNANTNTIVIS